MIPRADWTFAEAKAANDAALAADPARVNDPALPLYQWSALQGLETLRTQFDAGDRMALLAAIRSCANHDLPLPAWAAKAFIRAYDEVLNCRADSWDAVFGVPYPKGSQLNAMRKRRVLRFAVWNAVNAMRMRDEPQPKLTWGLFEKVGKQMRPPIGRTIAEKLYYEAQRKLGR